MCEYAAADVTAAERAITHRMVRHLIAMLADEPPQDAGGHPAMEVHQQVGAAWADWDQQRRAWQTLLAPRLLREAMDDLRGGPDARPTTPAPTPAHPSEEADRAVREVRPAPTHPQSKPEAATTTEEQRWSTRRARVA